MTRDEAIAKSKKFLGSNTEEAIDLWSALGMLKLDEIKTVEDRFSAAVYNDPRLSRTSPLYVLEAIKSSGLQIVEKGQS